MKIPEIEAKDILLTYDGYNNQILQWRRRLEGPISFKLTRTQANYILKHHKTVPKVARKYVEVVGNFGEKLMEQRRLASVPKRIWVEKLLCESDKAYHMWGKVIDADKFYPFWVPKASIIPQSKKLNDNIDLTKYNLPDRDLFEHQKVAIKTLLANNKFILADDMGLGKTTSAIIASLEIKPKKVLIVCPASLKINWQREIEIYSKKKIFIVEGRKWGSTFDYYIINYDILKNYHTIDKEDSEEGEVSEDIKLIADMKFDLVILDEAHYISNTSAKRTQLINDIVETIPKVWLLTGTPMTSRPINYFNLLKLVRSPITLNWQTYVRRYCDGFQFFNGTKRVWRTSGASHLDELRESTKNLVLRRLKTEVLDLPDKIVTPIYLELFSKFYDEEYVEFLKILKKEKKKQNLKITLPYLMKARQIIAMEKLPYTFEIIDKYLAQDKKVIVFTNFTATLQIMQEKYKNKCVILDGKMNKTKKQDSVDKFQNNPKVKVFIANLQAGGVGHNLTKAECVIMNDLCFVPGNHSQAEDRAFRIGQKKNVSVYYPIFENTIEKIIYNIVNKKKNNIDQVMGDNEYSEGFAKELLKELL